MFSIWSLVTGWSNEKDKVRKTNIARSIESYLGNGTVAEIQGDLISNDTLREGESRPDEISGTAWSQQLWVNFQKLFNPIPLSISISFLFQKSSLTNWIFCLFQTRFLQVTQAITI